MTDNVTLLQVPKPGPKIQENVVGQLETLLKRAKSGGMQSLALVYVNPQGNPVTIWMRGDRRTADCWPLIAGLSCLHDDMVTEVNAPANVVEGPPPEEPA